jgi:CRP-like cAMP-binding protein
LIAFSGAQMSLESDIRLLQTSPFFAALQPEALRLIAFAAETRNFRPGESLFRQGDVADGGYVVVSGEVTLQDGEGATKSDKTVGSGALIGELALLIPSTRPVTAVAQGTASAIKISRALFLRALEESPASARRLLTEMTLNLVAYSSDMRKVQHALADTNFGD